MVASTADDLELLKSVRSNDLKSMKRLIKGGTSVETVAAVRGTCPRPTHADARAG